MRSAVSGYNRPLVFYGLATAVPWTCWLAAGWISHLEHQDRQTVWLASLLGLAGLIAPFCTGIGLMLGNQALLLDLRHRLIRCSPAGPFWWAIATGLMPASILAAMGLSLLFGYSPDQFRLADHASFSSGVFPVWFLLVAAPVIEELGWHTYGTDCLRSRFSLFFTSLVFALYWALWHLPLATIKDYYQSRLAGEGLLAALNFPASMVPFFLIMNWLYYRSGRNVAITAVFHVTAGLFNEMFRTDPDSKLIQTALLIAVAAVIVVADRDRFFSKELPRDRTKAEPLF